MEAAGFEPANSSGLETGAFPELASLPKRGFRWGAHLPLLENKLDFLAPSSTPCTQELQRSEGVYLTRGGSEPILRDSHFQPNDTALDWM